MPMNTLTLRPQRTRPSHAPRFRPRTPVAAAPSPFPSLMLAKAEHDFLVPNPRPDLMLDPQTLRMIDVG